MPAEAILLVPYSDGKVALYRDSKAIVQAPVSLSIMAVRRR